MKKNAIYVVALLLLIGGVVLGFPTLYKLSVLVPGPEGPTNQVYGIQWANSDPEDGGFKILAQAQPGQLVGRYMNDYVGIIAWERPDPYNPCWEWAHGLKISEEGAFEVYNSLYVEMRLKTATIDQMNYQGDPLGGASTFIEWFSYETEPTGTNTIQWTKYGCYVLPVDFVIEISVLPGWGGDKWGAINDLHIWLVLDTTVWLNAFTENQLINADTLPENVTLSAYAYRGCWPIWMWVSGWDPWITDPDKWSRDTAQYGLGVENQYQESVKPKDLPDELFEYTQIQPSIEGSRVPLYTEPDYQHQTNLFADDLIQSFKRGDTRPLENGLQAQLPLPDPRFSQTVYFPITLRKVGALKQWSGLGPWYEERYYYPSTFLRIRCLYAVWGEWVYLWTAEEAEKYDYEWQSRTSTIVEHTSTWDQFWGAATGVLLNPFFWLTSGIIGFFILLVLILIFAPKAFELIVQRLFAAKKKKGKG